MKTRFTMAILAILITTSCTSVSRMIEQGEYEAAMAKLHKKMSGRKIIPDRYIEDFSKVYQNLNSRDINQIKRLKSSNRSEEWRELITIYDKIDKRQSKTQALLPELEKYDVYLDIDFVNIAKDRAEAKQTYLSILEKEIFILMKLARQEDKAAAREAFYKAQAFQDYQLAAEIRLIEREARDLGTDRVGVQFLDHTGDLLVMQAMPELRDLILPDNQWTEYYTDLDRKDLDFVLSIIVRESIWSPDLMDQKRYLERKDITGGFEYVLDANGNVKKDSLGNDIKIPVVEKVKARITEITQQKNLVLGVDIKLVDSGGKSLTLVPLTTEVNFRHIYATFHGNERALSLQTKKLLKNLPLPFPGEFQMLMDGILQIKPVLLKEIKKLSFSQHEI